MTRPLIGISAYAQEASFGSWTLDAALVPHGYVRSVEQAGGRALVIPPSDGDPHEVLAVVQGLVFSGGADVDPAHYGAAPHPETQATSPDRDRAELALLAAALEARTPVLAVCRGMELLNVGLGGTLHQHLPDAVGDQKHRTTPGSFSHHDVETAAGSELATSLGARARVNSHHHQAIAALGVSLTATAWADDGTIEGVELESDSFVIGVQWHPEELHDDPLFARLIDHAVTR